MIGYIMHAWNGMQQRRAGKSTEKTCSSGWRLYRIDHKVYRNYFWADTVLDVVLN